MRRLPLWLLMAIPLAGCSGPGDSPQTPPQGPVAPSITEAPKLETGSLALLGESDADKVQVGAEAEKALLVFPAVKKHLDVNTLPKRIPSDMFSAEGWE